MQPVPYLDGSHLGTAMTYCPPGMVWSSAFLVPMPGGYMVPYMQPSLQPGMIWRPTIQQSKTMAHAGTAITAAPSMQMGDATMPPGTLKAKDQAYSEEDDSQVSQQMRSISAQRHLGHRLHPDSLITCHTRRAPGLPRGPQQLHMMDQLLAAADAASKELRTVSQSSVTAGATTNDMPWQVPSQQLCTLQEPVDGYLEFAIEPEDEDLPARAGPRVLRKPIHPETLKASLTPMVFDDVRETRLAGVGALQVQAHCPYGNFQGQLMLVPDKKPKPVPM